jgi:hypothetical protein
VPVTKHPLIHALHYRREKPVSGIDEKDVAFAAINA